MARIIEKPPQPARKLKHQASAAGLAPGIMNHAALKSRHREIRDAHPASLTLRVHRALSWLEHAEQTTDTDGRFLFLWIAFNAAYAQEISDSEQMSDKAMFTAFLKKICDLDKGKKIDALVWKEFSGAIRSLMDNPYVFNGFWEFQRGKLAQDEWKKRFASAKKAARAALSSGDTAGLLGIVFSRMYTLRGQLVHGGATWGGKVNRDQLRDCAGLLGKLAPLIIELMMENPGALWGEAVYPVIDADK